MSTDVAVDLASDLASDPEAAADAAGLRYVDDDGPGISRRRRGRGFSYHLPDGSLLVPERVRPPGGGGGP